MTPEEITKMVADGIAAGLKAHTEANPPITPETIGKIVQDQIKGLDVAGKVSAASKKLIEEAAAETARRAAEAQGAGDATTENEARVNAAYEKRLAELEAQSKELAGREADATAKERATRKTTMTSAALLAAGIPSAMHDKVLPYLFRRKSSHSKEPAIHFDDDGALKWRSGRKGFEDILTVEAGVKEWVATDDAKLYRPAIAINGTGNGPGDGRGGSGGAKPVSFAEMRGR